MSSTTVHPRLRKVTALLVGVLALALNVGSAAASECGCTQTGAYQAPASKPPAATSSKYSVTATSSTVTVRRTDNNAIVFERPRQTGAAWGFGDRDRFVYQYLSGTVNTVHNVVLYDLVAKTTLKELSAITTTSRVVFSPNGSYMLYSAVVSGQTSLTVVDAVTGGVSYQTQFTPYGPPGSSGDAFGLASWGFSSEAANRTFVFGRTTSQTTVQLSGINLVTRQLVVDVTIGGSGWWQFSPCGDALGVVTQSNQTNVEISLYKTATRAARFAGRTTSVATITLSTTLESHLAKVAGTTTTTYVLAPNVADNACSTLSNLSVTTPATGGQTATATVTLTGPAPAGGLVLSLTSSNPAVAKPRASSVTVAAGSSTATVLVDTFPVTTDTVVTISVSSGGVTKTAPVTVKAPVLSQLTISPNPVAGGSTASGTVHLSGMAPSAGTTVTLSSSDPAVARLSTATVTVAANATSAGFAIFTAPVPADVGVTISASAGNVSKSVVVTVKAPALGSLWTQPTVPPGSEAAATVFLQSPASGDVIVALASSDTARAPVQPTVTVVAGRNSADFRIPTTPGVDVQVTISATLGTSRQAALLTIATPPAVASLSVSPQRVVGGGAGGASATVTLDRPALAGGAQVTISTTDAGLTGVPGTITVPAGATSASFPVTTPAAVSVDRSVTIRASAGGQTRDAVLTIAPPPLTGLSVTSSADVWSAAFGTVVLAVPAPAGGIVVALDTSDADVALPPSSVTVPAGASRATFGFSTGEAGTATITASANGGSDSDVILVTDPCAGNPRCQPL